MVFICATSRRRHAAGTLLVAGALLIGELLMETELLYAKVDQLEASGPLARRRSTR